MDVSIRWRLYNMKGYSVYKEIKQLKELGLKKAQVASRLGLNRRTVDRYWEMSVDEFDSMITSVRRRQALDEYRETILQWIHDYSSISAAQINDWLKENYGVYFKNRTVSRYVRDLREEYALPKKSEPRSYEAVPELPMGQQVQVDFGEMKLKDSGGGTTKVWFAAFLLSHSRYLFVELQSRPYTAAGLAAACSHCFTYFGGMPREMVFDQDSIVCVSENAGDIIYTYEFEKFRQEHSMKIYLCRGNDPESKGKIENTVKYVKGNFLANRLYVDDETLNASCIKWLERTANVRVHGTTKRIPSEVFLLEKEKLRAVPHADLPVEKANERIVRKDNTIVYSSNRYSLPFGTYNRHKVVEIDSSNGTLIIKAKDGTIICEHRISEGRGMLIKNRDHSRNKESSINQLQINLDRMLECQAGDFLKNVRLQKGRYARDQFSIVESLINIYGVRAVLEGTDFCSKNRLYSASFLRDYLASSNNPDFTGPPVIDTSKIPVQDPRYHVKTEKRPLEAYSKVGG